ncbi:sulfatase-like hydrolase/transferase [Tissierellaceae bacterium HCP3S3_D8]
MNNTSLSQRLKEQSNKNTFFKGILTIVIIGILSFLIMTMTFVFSNASLNIPLFQSYFRGKWLMLMNFIPIFLLMIFFSLVFNRLWISFAITSTLFFVMSIVNRYKLIYRDEPFTFIDLKLVTESMDMAQKYKLSLSKDMIAIVIGIILITIISKKLITYRINSNKIRISFLILTVIVGVLVSTGFYFNQDLYDYVGDKSLINIWSQTQQFQSKGFVYPFIYSVTNVQDRKLEGYDEDRAKELLAERNYNDIPNDQKVNVIAIMLESYNDFTKFDGVDLDIDAYENFHKLQEESYSGRLIDNVFGGGTINTEWSFLTGYNSHPKYVKDTNSFVHYFKEQGYRTEAMHPNYGWFYNRRNVNEYIGFDNYDYYENKYEAIQKEFLDDYDFFDFIINGYEDSKSNGEPYFNFSVTYQNHGPYSFDRETDLDYLKRKPEYTGGLYNIINNYLSGIKKTDDALKKLTDYFSEQEEPTVIVLFGDHNPWLGEDASGYNMMGINIDLSTVDGFKNYYETPYIIWGNPKAKEVLNRDFVGQGNTISPNFLMAELFQYLGWGGNEYMEYINYVKENFDVNHDMYFKEDGEFTRKLSDERLEIWKDFNFVQYYYSRNFIRK